MMRQNNELLEDKSHRDYIFIASNKTSNEFIKGESRRDCILIASNIPPKSNSVGVQQRGS
jgi:hypothetical protein